ncbi:MAG TPA: hypothetical protein VFB48_03445 [Nitrososphaeraceae archaeon]|nr:hypothetical protein [Nitrososphaeraceae archaeon]
MELDILEGNNLATNLFERYSANSRNWKFVVSVTQQNGNFYDAIVSNPNEVWQLKIDSIYKPNPLIIGTKVDVDPLKFNDNTHMPFGYRRLDPKKIGKILSNINESEDTSALSTYIASLISSTKPEVPSPNNSYAYGPFLFTQKNPIKVDDYQRKISDKLANRLNDKLRMIYSSYG